MRTSRWSAEARRQFEGWFGYIFERNEAAAIEAAGVMEAQVEKLAMRPFAGRASRWPDLREASLPRWRKLLVYEVQDLEVVIIAFYDTRQDLSVVSPTPERR